MKKAIPLGIMDYKEFKENDYYTVDKTMMIKDFLSSKRKVTLITRPRRFGKTLNMSMMSEFFDITKDSKELFKDTQIMKTEYINEMNKYPTLFLSFANAKGKKEEIITSIKFALLKLYQQNKCVLDNIDEFDMVMYQQLKSKLMQFDSSSLDGIGNAISFLMEQLEKYYHQKVMLFIDEYDTPFIEAHVGGFYSEVKSGLASLLHNALKLSPSLQYAMLTGIQRVAKENIFSDLNNPIVCTVADQRYAPYFGFVEEEVKELLDYYDLDFNEEVKEMYDGYHIGNFDIYNPWSIINYADNKQLIPYWVNTSANIMIKNAIKDSDTGFRQEYERLIQDGRLETRMTLETSFYEYSSSSSLWGLLVNAGYLTIEETVSPLNSIYKVRIPNQEVQREFIDLTEYYLSVKDARLSLMLRYLVEEKQDLFIQEYRNILMLPSYHDLKNENSYHMMMLGMCICLSNDYEVISNREEGKGRCDLILKAKKKKPSFVIEFKYTKDSKELETLVNEAVKQIEEQQYDYELTGKVNHIGLAHFGKDVRMKWIAVEK